MKSPADHRIHATRMLRGALVLALAVLPAACDDDPFELRWEENPEEAVLYSLDRPELNLRSVYDLRSRIALPIEAPATTSDWDIGLVEEAGGLALVTPATFGFETRARITVLENETFEAVREAPSDTTLYTSEVPVPLDTRHIYIVRTHEQRSSFGQRCVYYAKLEPLELDETRGSLRFLFDVSPVCNDRRLVPPN